MLHRNIKFPSFDDDLMSFLMEYPDTPYRKLPIYKTQTNGTHIYEIY